MSSKNYCDVEDKIKDAYVIDTHRGGYEGLAIAVITQAVSDYDMAITRLKSGKFTHNESEYCCKKYVSEVRKFFKSPQFCMLTNLDADYLMDMINQRLCNKLGVDKNEMYI